MILIDEELTREQLGFLSPDVVQRLLDAARDDLARWSRRLMMAWSTRDAEAIRQARHAIRGICSTFGAARLSEAAEGNLATSGARDAYDIVREATLRAIDRVSHSMGVS